MPGERLIPEMAAPIEVRGAGEWLVLSDDLLAGLVHALNNRVTALSVCAELAALGDEEMLSGGMLQSEVARLQRASTLVGRLPARGHAEALELAPVLDDAIAIHAHHPRMRGIECSVELLGATEPVRVPRWALLRLLIVLVDVAKRGAQNAERGVVTVQLSSDERSVRVTAPARESGGVYANEMATLCGGVLARDGEKLALIVPSLTELRKRERMGGASG